MMRRIQEEHKVWTEKNFGKQETWEPLMGALEELGELAHAHLKHHQGIRKNEGQVELAKDAVGDVIIFLISYCTLRGFDIQDIIEQTWEEVKERDWVKSPETGRENG